METKTVQRKYNSMAYIMALLIIAIIAGLWFFVFRNPEPEMIQPVSGGDTSSTQGIPPDSLRH